MEEFGTRWEGLEDARTGNAALHDFHELLSIGLCTVLCGGQNATAMAEFVKAKELFLKMPTNTLASPSAFANTDNRGATRSAGTAQNVEPGPTNDVCHRSA